MTRAPAAADPGSVAALPISAAAWARAYASHPGPTARLLAEQAGGGSTESCRGALDGKLALAAWIRDDYALLAALLPLMRSAATASSARSILDEWFAGCGDPVQDVLDTLLLHNRDPENVWRLFALGARLGLHNSHGDTALGAAIGADQRALAGEIIVACNRHDAVPLLKPDHTLFDYMHKEKLTDSGIEHYEKLLGAPEDACLAFRLAAGNALLAAGSSGDAKIAISLLRFASLRTTEEGIVQTMQERGVLKEPAFYDPANLAPILHNLHSHRFDLDYPFAVWVTPKNQRGPLLHHAHLRGKHEAMRLLLAAGATPFTDENDASYTELLTAHRAKAAMSDTLEMVRARELLADAVPVPRPARPARRIR